MWFSLSGQSLLPFWKNEKVIYWKVVKIEGLFFVKVQWHWQIRMLTLWLQPTVDLISLYSLLGNICDITQCIWDVINIRHTDNSKHFLLLWNMKRLRRYSIYTNSLQWKVMTYLPSGFNIMYYNNVRYVPWPPKNFMIWIGSSHRDGT